MPPKRETSTTAAVGACALPNTKSMNSNPTTTQYTLPHNIPAKITPIVATAPFGNNNNSILKSAVVSAVASSLPNKTTTYTVTSSIVHPGGGGGGLNASSPLSSLDISFSNSSLSGPTSPNSNIIADAVGERVHVYVANAKLCRLVRKCPWMYDRNHQDYQKKHILDKSWSKIARECNDSVASCKERWRNIRAAFARSINIYKTHGGPNRVKPYYLHKELTFLIKPMLDGREKVVDSTDKPDEGKDDVEELEVNGEMTLDDILLDNADLDNLEEDFDKASENLNGKDDQNSNAEMASDAEHDFNSNTNASLLRKVRRHAAQISSSQQAASNNPQQHSSTYEPETKRMRLNNACFAVNPQPALFRIKTEEPSSSLEFLDADSKFLEALLPDMRCMNARQKIIFKRKIYQSLEEVFETTTDFPYSSHNASFNYNPCYHQHAPGVAMAEHLMQPIDNLNDSDLQRLNSIHSSTNNEESAQPIRCATAPPVSAVNESCSSPAPPPLTPAPQQNKRSNSDSLNNLCIASSEGTTTVNTRSNRRRSIRVVTLPKETEKQTLAAAAAADDEPQTAEEDDNNNNTTNTTTSGRRTPPWDQLIPIAVKEEIDDVDID